MSELKTEKEMNHQRLDASMSIIIGIVLFCFCSLLIGIFSVKRYQKKQFEAAYEQGCSYYAEKNYEEAINSYQKALNYPSKLELEIALKISNAYIELKKYDEAAEILQTYYDKTNSSEVRNKVEQTIDLLIDSEYTTNLERGNIYSQAEEYRKAILEYLAAYKLKPESEEALEYVIDAYLNNSEIDHAQQMLDEAKEQCSQEVIQKLQQEIDLAAVKEQYDALLVEADEFFYNESYEECFQLYDEAVALLPYESGAYEAIVNAYVSLQQYEKAIDTIKNYESKYKYSKLEDILNRIQEDKETQERISELLKILYYALSDGDMEEVLSILNGEEYKNYIQEGVTYYYNAIDKRASTQIPTQKGLIIYGSGYIYRGSILNGKRSGKGNYFTLTSDTLGYMLYTGAWKDDLPNGEGTLNTVMQVPYQNEQKEFVVKVQGTYRNGLENGRMRRDFYLDGSYFGTLEYSCTSGIPQSKNVSLDYYKWYDEYTYVIGEFETIEGTEEFYYINTEDRWKIPGI